MRKSELMIGFAGAQSTGKTVLAREVSKSLGIPFRGSFARTYLTSRGISYEELAEDKDALFEFQLKCFKWALQLKAPFVTDRTIFDMMAYSIAELGFIYSKKREYTKVFFLPFREELLEQDNVRIADPTHARMIHHMILAMLYKFKVDFHFVKSYSLEGRLWEIKEVLDGLRIGKVS